MTLVAAVFLGVLALVVGSYFVLVVRPESEQQSAVRKRLKKAVRRESASLVKEIERLSAVPILERLLAHATSIVQPIRRLIDQAGYSMTVGAFVLATVCAGGIPLMAMVWATRHLLIAVLVGLCTGLIPFLWVRRARARRLWKFEEQFPEGIDLIARALRAGHTFPTGLLMVADDLQPPIGTEFRLIYERQNFGMPIGEALRDFAERTPVLDAKFFATAVLTQREAGGNLAEVLDNLSSVIRERFKVKRQVRVLSAHGRITGWILAGLPPSLALVFTIMNPDHMRLLFYDPMGIKMVYAGIALQVVGTLIIKKLVNIEY